MITGEKSTGEKGIYVKKKKNKGIYVTSHKDRGDIRS